MFRSGVFNFFFAVDSFERLVKHANPKMYLKHEMEVVRVTEVKKIVD
jgi:hypothetical protein